MRGGSTLADESIRDAGESLHDRLIAGDPTAPALIAEQLLPPIHGSVSRYRAARFWDEQVINDAVVDAYLDYIENPGCFKPASGSLEAFLRLAAFRNLINFIDKEATRKKYEKAVELEHAERNDSWEEQILAQDERRTILSKIPGETTEEKLAHILPDSLDQSLCLLMLGGERDTESFAELLGFAPDDPIVRREVKRHKDRITKVLQRFGKKLHDGHVEQ